MSSWSPPQIEVLGIERDGDTTFVDVHLKNELTLPGAPALLQFDDGSTTTLHALVSLDGLNAVFRTSETLPAWVVGACAGLQQLWTPDAHVAVTDLRRSWTKEPPSTDHEHCVLDWTKIGPDEAVTIGWCSDGEWICDDCYDEYIVCDRLRLRS